MSSNDSSLLSSALRTCRDVELTREERTEFDLISPERPRTTRGLALRVNHGGRSGFAWGEGTPRGEDLLEQAIEDSGDGPEAILFAHGILPPVRSEAEPDIEQGLERLRALIKGLDFMLPPLLPEREFRVQARLLRQRLTILTRAGERSACRLLYFLTLRSAEDPPLTAGMYTARPDDTPAEILCRLAWRTVHSREVAWPESDHLPAVFTSTGTGRLLQDLARDRLDVRAGPEAPVPGEAWLHPAIRIQDDGTVPGALGTTPFDGEGLPRGCVPLVEKGRLVRALADRSRGPRTRPGEAGLAVRDWGQAPRPGYSNLVMGAGDSSLGELCSEIQEGLLLDRLTPVPGRAEPGQFCRRAETAFLILDGQPVCRIPPVLVRARYEELLGSRLQALGFERSWHGRTFAPPVSVSGITLEEADPDTEEDFSDLPGCWW